MDPVSTISFACNIIQLVELSTKVVVGAADIYRDGTKQENADLNDVTASLIKYTATVKGGSSGPCDKELQEIADKAEKAATELTTLLERLSVPKDAEHRKWKTVRVTVKSLRKQEKVRSLESRLQSLQALLNSWMLRAMRDETSTVQRDIAELGRHHKDLGTETTQSLEHIKQTLSKIEELIAQDRKDEQGQPPTLMPDPPEAEGSAANSGGVLSAIKRYLTPWPIQSLNSAEEDDFQSQREMQIKAAMRHWPEVHEQMIMISNEAKTIAKDHALLLTLHHRDLDRRFIDVEEKYPKTCQWIFDNQEHGFKDWLASGEGTYWISGKPGAGKSTLMRFIFDQQETRDVLAEWVGEGELLIVKHFFWVSGTKMQRSYEGLLRSMLLQYLLRWPRLISLIFGGKSDPFNHRFDSWTLKDLFQCLDRLLAHLPRKAKILVLVDGLDECEYDHGELISFLDRFVSPGQSKLCVSSRLWNIFERSYRPRGNHLRVENLTREDIRLFVEGKLLTDPFMGPLLDSERSTNVSVIDSLLDRAEGVFLWVKLVVRLLSRDAPNEPTIPELHNLITEYPVDIDQLYDRMLWMIERSGFIQEAVRIFRIFLDSSLKKTIDKIWFMNMEKEDPNYAVARPIRPYTEFERIQFGKAYFRLKGRCMDFLQSTEIERSGTDSGMLLNGTEEVDFFHRTAYDFLKQRTQWLKNAAGASFEPWHMACKATLGSLKSLELTLDADRGVFKTFRKALWCLLRAADVSERLYNKPLLAELDEGKRCFMLFGPELITYNLRTYGLSEPSYPYPYNDMNIAFMGLTIRYGLVAFVKRELERSDDKSYSNHAKIQCMMDFALMAASTEPIMITSWPGINSQIVQMLLSRHGDPNGMSTILSDKTVWVGFLKEISKPGHFRLMSKEFKEVIGLLLDYGANPFVVVDWESSTGDSRSGPIEELFQELLSPDDALFEKLAQSRRRAKKGKIWGRFRRRLC